MADKTTTKRAPIEISKRGVFAFAWLNKPDEKFSGPDKPARYKVSLVIDKSDEDAVAWARELAAQHKKAGGKKNEGPVVDGDVKYKDTKYEEGFKNKILVNFKTYKKPGLVDARKQPLPDDVHVFAGDIGRVSFTRNEYSAGATKGLSLYLAAVQLLDKRAGSGIAQAGVDAFDEQDGYVAADRETAGETGADRSDDADGDF